MTLLDRRKNNYEITPFHLSSKLLHTHIYVYIKFRFDLQRGKRKNRQKKNRLVYYYEKISKSVLFLAVISFVDVPSFLWTPVHSLLSVPCQSSLQSPIPILSGLPLGSPQTPVMEWSMESSEEVIVMCFKF